MYIDPPSGWKYGFPKVLPNPMPEDLYDWLVSKGYPQKEIDSCGKHFYYRIWEGDWTCPFGNEACVESCGKNDCKD